MDDFIKEFIGAVQNVFPGPLVQFEDFNTAAVLQLIERHRERLCCFNDDVQGTGAMCLAGLMCTAHICGGNLVQRHILFAGAGKAGPGIGGRCHLPRHPDGRWDADAREITIHGYRIGLALFELLDLHQAHSHSLQEDATDPIRKASNALAQWS